MATERAADAERGDERRQGTAVRVLKGAGAVATAVLVLLVSAILLLQLDSVATRVVNAAVARFAPWESMHVARAELDGLSQATLVGLRIRDEEGDTLLRADTVRLALRLPGLLRHRLDMPVLRIAGARVRMEQADDSTWDLLAPFAQPDTIRADRGAAWSIRIGDASIGRSSLYARYAAPADSVLGIEAVTLRASDLALGDALRVDLDTLGARILPPGRPESPVRLAASARLAGGRLVTPGILLQSDSSDVHAAGELLLPGGAVEQVEDIDFTIRAAPLDFTDIGALIPGFDRRGDLRLTGKVTGSERVIDVDLDGSTSDGATLRLSGTLTPYTDGPVRYALNGTIEDVDPGLFTSGPSTIDDVDITFDVALAGPRLDALNGRLQVQASARFGDAELRPTTIAGKFSDGVAQVTLNGAAAPWASFEGRGTMQPFATAPAWNLTIDARQLDPVSVGGGNVAGVRARIVTSGAGIAAAETRGEARITLAGGIGRARLQDGSIRARWADGTATARVRLPVDSGTLAGRAHVDWTGDVSRIRLPMLRAERLAVAAILGDTLRGTLTADLSGGGTLGSPESLEGHVSAVLERATWGTLVVDTGRVTIDANDGTVTIDGMIASAAGRVGMVVRARPFAEVPTYVIRRLAAENLNLALAREGMPQSDIDATLHGELRGSGAQALRGSARLVLEQARIGTRSIDSARVDFDIERGSVAADGTARLLGGRIALDAMAEPFATPRTVHVERIRFENLRLDSLAGPRLQTALSGTLRMDATLPADTFPSANGTLTLDGGPFNDGRIENGTVEFALAMDGSATADARIATGTGRVAIEGAGTLTRVDSTVTLQGGRVDGTLHLPDIGRLAGMDTVDAGLDARFTARALAGDSAGWALVLGARGTWEDLTVDTLRADARYAAGILRVDTLRVQSNALHGGGGGAIALGEGARRVGDTLRIALEVDSASALGSLAGGAPLTLRNGSITALAVGTEAGARIDARLAAGGFIRNRMSADTVVADVRALIVDGSLERATVEADGTRLAAATAFFDAASLDVSYDSTGAGFSVTARKDDTHAVRATGMLRPDAQSVLLRQIELEAGDTRWTLEESARVTWGDRIAVDSLRLTTDGSGLLVDGHIDRAGTQDLTMRLDSVRISDFASFAGMSQLSGVASGRLRLEGPASRVSLNGTLTTVMGGATADVTIDTRPTNERLAIEAVLRDAQGDPLRVDGSLPFTLSLEAAQGEPQPAAGGVDLIIAADSFDLDWATALTEPLGVKRLEGSLAADVRIAGTWETPRLDGAAHLRAGRIEMPPIGVRYHDMRAALAFDGQDIRIDTLRAQADGSALIHGRVRLTSLSEPQLDLEANLDAFHLITNRFIRLNASGDLGVAGTPLAPQVTGDLTILDTDIHADAAGVAGGAASVELKERDYEMLASYFGYTPERASRAGSGSLMDPMGLDMAVELGPAVWVRRDAQPELRILLDGDLEVRKEPDDSLQLFGSISTVPQRSTFEQFGRQFQVTEGTVTFNGAPASPRVDVTALYEVPSFQDPSSSEVDITLAVTGDVDDLEVTLGSDPTMETTDIISYIATGRPASSAIEFGGGEGGNGGVLGTGARYALGAATGALGNLAADVVGLSVVDVEQTPEGARLIAGRYVSPRLFVGFQQPLSGETRQDGVRNEPQGTELEVEYTAFEWLLVNLQGSASQFQSFFRFKRAF